MSSSSRLKYALATSLTRVVTTALRFSSVASRSARAASVARRSRPQTSTSNESRLSATVPKVRRLLEALQEAGTLRSLELRKCRHVAPAATVGNWSARVIPRLARAASTRTTASRRS